MRVLVVEDEWLVAEDHAGNVRQAGHEVIGPVPSVEAALARIADDEVEAALLDIHLNGETSYGIADQLVLLRIPFAFLTGFNELQIPARFLNIPLKQKPTSGDEIKRVLADFSVSIQN